MKLNDSEWQLMSLLWEKHPATAREIGERLPEDVSWAYTTIKTLLSRLVKKNAIAEKKIGNVSVYEPLISQKNAQRSAVKSLLQKAFGGTVGPMLHFLMDEQDISESKRKEMLKILDEMDREQGEES